LENGFINVSIFNSTLVYNEYISFFKIIVLVTFLVCVFNAKDFLIGNNLPIDEFFILLSMLLLGIFFFLSSYDLVSLFFNMELQSFCFYILITFKRNSLYSSEAALKYFVTGTVSAGIFLLGVFFIYSYTGLTNFEDLLKFFSGVSLFNGGFDSFLVAGVGIIFIFSGFLFKMAIAPFHMWVPDVYDGSPTCTTIAIATLPKIAFLSVFIRFFYITFFDLIEYWQYSILILSSFSIFVSCFVGIYQQRVKRLIAYSSIGHMGFILLGLSTCLIEGLQSSIIYLIVYLSMSLCLWTILISKSINNQIQIRYISDLSFIFNRNKTLGFILSFIFFSMAGIPPFGGFFAKMLVLSSVVKASYLFLVCFILILSMVSSFYYVRFIKILYFDVKIKSPFEFNSECIGREKSLVVSFSFFFILFFFYFLDFINLLVFKLSLYIL
jgi:NADH-quinone oxidoreductase subunit N